MGADTTIKPPEFQVTGPSGPDQSISNMKTDANLQLAAQKASTGGKKIKRHSRRLKYKKGGAVEVQVVGNAYPSNVAPEQNTSATQVALARASMQSQSSATNDHYASSKGGKSRSRKYRSKKSKRRQHRRTKRRQHRRTKRRQHK